MASLDLDYYARRERQARALAERAGDSCARAAHLAMAQRYQELVTRVAPASGGHPASPERTAASL